MAAVCWFFHYTPAEYEALTISQLNRLLEFMNEYLKAQKKGR